MNKKGAAEDCNCRYSDAWRCARDQELIYQIACLCPCHMYIWDQKEVNEKELEALRKEDQKRSVVLSHDEWMILVCSSIQSFGPDEHKSKPFLKVADICSKILVALKEDTNINQIRKMCLNGRTKSFH